MRVIWHYIVYTCIFHSVHSIVLYYLVSILMPWDFSFVEHITHIPKSYAYAWYAQALLFTYYAAMFSMYSYVFPFTTSTILYVLAMKWVVHKACHKLPSFSEPLPIPINTIPIQGRVWVHHENAWVYILNPWF